MAYDVNLTIPKKRLNFISLLDYICYHYSDMSVGVVGHDFDYDHGSCLCGDDWCSKMKDMWLEAHIKFKLDFQPRISLKFSETLQMLWGDPGREGLTKYVLGYEKAHAHRQDTTLLPHWIFFFVIK